MVVIVSFSGRKDGNCRNIANFCANYIQDSSLFSFSDFSISPCGNCAYECFRDRDHCPRFHDMEFRLLDSITRADRAIFVVPNYCDYPCANFFIFNERSQCYFQGHPELLDAYLKVPKKFIVISNTAQANFQEAFTQHADREPNILYLSAKAFGKRCIDGNILDTAEAVTSLERFINNG